VVYVSNVVLLNILDLITLSTHQKMKMQDG